MATGRAICLDLDIAVEGRSFEDVLDSLQEAISLYLQMVADLPPVERSSLLHRPVLCLVRLKFLAQAARGLFSSRDGDKQRLQFTFPAAA
jgi:hypothetical protein